MKRLSVGWTGWRVEVKGQIDERVGDNQVVPQYALHGQATERRFVTLVFRNLWTTGPRAVTSRTLPDGPAISR